MNWGVSSQQENDMNVVYALTRNLYPHLAPSVRSLIEHNPKANVYVLAEDDELPVELPCKAKVINVSSQQYFPVNSVNYGKQFTYMALMRATYAELFPKMKKCIQLDVDTIVCDDLSPIWKTDMKGKWMAACPEYTGQFKPYGQTYYNIGVAVFNLEQIRKDEILPDVIQFLNTVSVPYLEQDAWNKYGIEHDKIVPIDVRYNECFCCGYTDDPAVVHYAGIGDWYSNQYIPRKEYLDKYR